MKIGTNGIILLAHNIAYIGPILNILVPLESPGLGLLIGFKMVQIEPMQPMLWTNKVKLLVPIFPVLHLANRGKIAQFLYLSKGCE